MLVGVRLPREPVDLGEWLADAAAFEAAGATALWVDPAPGLDPLALTAALAAVTSRSLLVTAATAGPTLDTVARLGRGRLAVVADAAPAAGIEVFRRTPDGFEHHTGRWVETPAPSGRAVWRAALRHAADRGCAGLLVPAGPRLLDMLRNPDDPDQRHDLQLAVG